MKKIKRRYKLLFIILLGIILAIIINTTSIKSKTDLVSLGDSLSIGMTPYNVAGTSFNDYLKNYLENEHKLGSYNNEFSINHLRIHELNDYLKENKLGNFTRNPIKQVLAKADIITIAIGIDEFANLSLYEDISNNLIENYIYEMDNLLKNIREFYDKEIVIISLYPAYNLGKNETIEINNKLNQLATNYKCKYLDILAYSLNKNYFLNNTSYYMNYLAHERIANELINMLF